MSEGIVQRINIVTGDFTDLCGLTQQCLVFDPVNLVKVHGGYQQGALAHRLSLSLSTKFAEVEFKCSQLSQPSWTLKRSTAKTYK